MKFKQTSILLNQQVRPNEIPEGSSWVQLAEDLSNFVEWGAQVTNLMSAEKLLNAKNNVVVQIKNDVLVRVLERKTFAMVKDSIEFQGAVQRITSANLYPAQASNRKDLSTAHGSYFDGKYYGASLDAKVYSDFDTFKIVNSITDEEWRLAFTSAGEMQKVIGLIETNVENTIVAYLNALVKRLHVAMIENCHDNGREIKLLTLFNAKHGGTNTYTLAQIQADRDLNALFNDFVKATISKLTTYVQEMNKKYNDGTIVQFTPKNKIEVVLLTDFASDIKYITDPVDYNAPETPRYTDTVSWQTTTTSLMPTLAEVSKIVIDGGDEDDKIITNVVGIVYDTDGCGITTADGEKQTTVEYVGSEGFTNYHHHVTNRYFVDTRLASVILTLS